MIIDKDHKAWIVATLVLLVVSTTLYVVYARNSPSGPSGGSWPGLAFGVVGSLLMLFAGMLGARKKVPQWRIGSARAWLKGHIWLGLLSVPLILFHAGFRVGGLLEQILLVLFAVIIVSGIFGLVMQRYLPTVMKASLPAEAIHDQIPHVCGRLVSAADGEVRTACGSLQTVSTGAQTGGAEVETDTKEPLGPLRDFYLSVVRPYLVYNEFDGDVLVARAATLASPIYADATFQRIRAEIPSDQQKVLAILEQLCEERRQFSRQVRLHRWMHGWLLIHVPLSAALLVLGFAHAVVTLYY